MFTVISYDVVDDRRRTRVLKLLKGYGTHVQYSVFECDLSAQQLTGVQDELRGLIDEHTDSVRLYLLDEANKQRTRILGIGRVTVDPLYYLIGS